jgi:hypothetical protein
MKHNLTTNRPGIGDLTTAVLKSRFPEDIEQTRFQMLAVLTFVNLRAREGQTVTSDHFAEFAETDGLHALLLTQMMERRGLLTRTRFAGSPEGASSFALSIRPDAITALEAAEVAENRAGSDVVGA